MRFAACTYIYARGNIRWRQSSSHSNAICNQRFKNRIELRTQTQPLVAEHRGGTNSRMKRPQPQPPHRRGTFHRRLQPIYTEKHKVSCSGFLPKTKPVRHFHASSPLPFVITSQSHHFSSSPLPFVTSPLPFVTTSLHHRFPSSPLPIVTTSHRPHVPSSPVPFITTSLRHHFPSSPLHIVTASHRHHLPSSPPPFLTTPLHHHFPPSPLPFLTTSHRHHFPSSPTSRHHHFPSSPLPFLTTSRHHHFPSSPLPIVTSFLWLCIVRSRTTLHHSQFQSFLFFCDVHC